jgi:hypothetical protein
VARSVLRAVPGDPIHRVTRVEGGSARSAADADAFATLGWRRHSHVQDLEESMLAARGPALAEHAEHAGH